VPILLVKTSSLGDVVHNLPVVSDLRRHFPEAAIDWVVEEGFADIPRLHPAVRRVIPVAVRRWRKAPAAPATWREIGALRRLLRAETYDDVLDTQGLLKSALIARLARGSHLGFARDSVREPLAACLYERGLTVARDLHAVERNRALAGAAFAYRPGPALDYGIAAAPLAAAWLPLPPYAVLLTATSRDDKLWPEDDWLALGAGLAKRGLSCVLPGGTAAERGRTARLAARLPRAVAVPPLELRQLAGLLAGAALVVGVDTGLAHLAAALRRPTLGLYCATDPRLTGVYAGDTALNLGGPGAAPSLASVMAAAEPWLP